MNNIIQHENITAVLALIFLVVVIAIFVFSLIGEYKTLQHNIGIGYRAGYYAGRRTSLEEK